MLDLCISDIIEVYIYQQYMYMVLSVIIYSKLQ